MLTKLKAYGEYPTAPNRRLSRVLSGAGDYPYYTRNMDRLMHQPKHASTRRKNIAEYDSLSKKVAHLYTMKEIVLPEDETTIFNETLRTRLEDTNQQIKKWLTRWKLVIDHSMKRVKELAQANSKPIWQHFTANKPAKTRVSRKLSTRKHAWTIRMKNNLLMNVYLRMHKKRSSSRVIKATTIRYKKSDLISQMYKNLGKNRSTSSDKVILEVEEQVIEDRLGDVPM
jgi:hypothetical protein